MEKKLSIVIEQYHDIKKLFEQKLDEQNLIYHNKMKQCKNDYEQKIKILRNELKEQKNKFYLSNQHNEQIQNELRQEKDQMKIDCEIQVHFFTLVFFAFKIFFSY